MRVIVAALLALLVTGGCTRIVGNSSQLYLAQTYLPLPPDERTANTGGVAGAEGCAAGPVQARPRAPGERFTAQVLPGMTVHVVQSSYAATRQDNVVPTITDWHWTIPAAVALSPQGACADETATVPGWRRSDLLHVRALLSGAQLLRGKVAPSDQIKPYYFEEAMRAACAAGSGTGLSCAEKPFLDKFVAGLALNLRAQGQQEDGDPSGEPQAGPPFDAFVPANVLAASEAPQVSNRGYGNWYANLSGFRYPADLFLGGLQAERCRGPFSDGGIPNEAPAAQDAPVCKFAQTSLEWSAPSAELRLPGPSLAKISHLSLLRSGDPLFLFQPQNYLEPLDRGNGDACDGDPACLLRDRTMQGFTDIEILIPVWFRGGERRWVPIGMSLAAYENATGRVIVRISRSLDWLPESLILEDGKTITTARLGDGRRRVSLGFIDEGKKSGLGGDISVRSPKTDLLFAPGDVITVRYP